MKNPVQHVLIKYVVIMVEEIFASTSNVGLYAELDSADGKSHHFMIKTHPLITATFPARFHFVFYSSERLLLAFHHDCLSFCFSVFKFH